MGIAFHCKWFFSLGCCPFVVSGLTAQVIGPEAKPKGDQNKPPLKAGARPHDLNEEQIKRMAEMGQWIERVLMSKKKDLEDQEKQRKQRESFFRWLRLIIMVLAVGFGGWGAWKFKRKDSVRASDLPKSRTEELGLGVDGKGGVWRHEVSPWEK